MNVLLVSHHAPPHIGGVENLVQYEAEAFAKMGHQVTWVTSDGDGDGDALTDADGITVKRVWAWHIAERLFGIAYPLFAPSLLWHLWRAVGRADLVHVHGLVFWGSPIAALFARMRGKRCVCTDHGGLLQYRSSLGTLLLRVVMATVGRITAWSSHHLIAYNHDIEKLLLRLSNRDEKVMFLPNPVDVATFYPPSEEQRRAARAQLGWDERPRILCVSRLLPHKGVDVLLDVLDGAAGAFDVVLCGPAEDSMREHIRARGGICLDPRPREDVVTLYHAADVFALPSYNEGFPVAVQEALACGLPVVTSDTPAYDPYRGTSGLHLCEPKPRAVREQIERILAQRSAATPIPRTKDGGARWLQQLCGPSIEVEGAA